MDVDDGPALSSVTQLNVRVKLMTKTSCIDCTQCFKRVLVTETDRHFSFCYDCFLSLFRLSLCWKSLSNDVDLDDTLISEPDIGLTQLDNKQISTI